MMTTLRIYAFWILTFTIATLAFDIELEPSAAELKNKKTGDNILVSCRVDSDASAVSNLQWWSPSNELVGPSGHVSAAVNGQSIQLRILGAKKADEGVYRCEATVDGVTQTSEAEIKLFEKITFVDAPLEQHPEAGKDAEVRCVVEPSTVQIFWSRNNKVLDPSRGYEKLQDGMVLRIPKYDPDRDDDTYVCQAVHTAAGAFQVRNIEVSGHTRPTIVVFTNQSEPAFEGTNLKLQCGASGRPEAAYWWYKGADEQGEVIQPSDKYEMTDGPKGGLLTIQSLTKDDAGPYTCVAKNDVAQDSRTMTLAVFLKPRIEEMKNVTASKDETVQIDCKYSGDGDIKVFWNFRGEILSAAVTTPEPAAGTLPMPEESRRIFVREGENMLSLILEDVQMSDSDEYQCEAANDAGSAMKRVFLSITHKPVLMAKTDVAVRSFADNQVNFFCEVEAVPKPTWTWKSPGGNEIFADMKKYSLETSLNGLRSTLILTTKEDADYGMYTCVATNIVGSMEHTIEVLKVVVPPLPSQLTTDKSRPSYANVSIDSFYNLVDSNRPLEVLFLFATEAQTEEEAFEWETDAVRVPLKYDMHNWYKIPGMKPNTDYLIRARATNEAGTSEWSEELVYMTSAAQPPAAPIFKRSSGSLNERCEDVCQIEWTEPDSHGAAITEYRLTFIEVQFSDGDPVEVGEEERIDGIESHRRTLTLHQLAPNTYYSLKMFAVNSVGEGSPGALMIETSALTGVRAGMGAGAVVAIVILILLVILAVVDVGCYFQNQCGLLMCICVNCFGKTPPEVKEKEIAMEEGAKSDKEPLREREPEEKDANESTPMVPNGQTNGFHKATPV